MQDDAPADDTSGHVPAGPDGMVVAESQPVMPDQEPVVAAPAIQDVPVAFPRYLRGRNPPKSPVLKKS